MLVTYRPLFRGRLSSRFEPPLRSTRRKAPALVIALAAACALTAASATADPSVASKQAEAQSVLAQIQQLDSSLERAIEAYNLANVKLDRDQARPERQHQRARGREEEPRARAGAALGAARRHLHVRRPERRPRRPARGVEPRRHARPDGRESTASRSRTRSCSSRSRASAARCSTGSGSCSTRTPSRCRSWPSGMPRAPRSSQQLGERKQLLGSIQGEIAQLKAAEAARQAELQRQAQFAAQQRRRSGRHRSRPRSAIGSGGSVSPNPPHLRPRTAVSSGSRCSTSASPYVWGGASPSGFDCSGFVMYVYAQIGVSLPHSSYAQYGYGTPGLAEPARSPATSSSSTGSGHVGIYVGGGSFIHAPHTGDVVKISSLTRLVRVDLRRRPRRYSRSSRAPRSRAAKCSCDDAALQLQRRRHLVLVGGEVAREDREALDLLEARALGVHVVDDGLHATLDLLRGEPVRNRPGRA